MFFGTDQQKVPRSTKSLGIKIVNNEMNKRVSDIFHIKDKVSFYKPENYIEIQQKITKKNEERMDNRLRVNKKF